MKPEDLAAALAVAAPSERQELLALVAELELRKAREACHNDFLTFAKRMWPDFIEGAHHKKIATLFNDIAEGKLKRLIISLPPRHTKSEFSSFLFPAWFIGKNPSFKAIQVANTGELAEKFGRKVRDLMESEEYQDIFPATQVDAASRAAGRWNTSQGGDYYAAGTGAALAGRGANIAIIDDPHTEQEAMMARFKPEIFDKVYDWYTTGIRQRLQPDGAIIICMTRWGKRDLVGQILDRMTQRDDVDQWRYIEFPAILPSGNALWPEYWPLRLLNPIKAELPSFKWNAQYQQNPTNDDNAIVKRSDWQLWEKDEPPKVNYIIMTMDTAIEKTQTADYSAAIVFGVWENEEDGNTPHLILLNAWRDRLEFPELKAKAKELYKEWKPDATIIEKKASGGPLIYELRRAGVYVQEYTPSRGRAGVSNDKIARLNAVTDIFASKRVWAPDKRWAEEVIDEVADFPTGRYDDYVDCVSLALSRFRAGGFIGTQHDKEDYDDEEVTHTYKTKKYY